MLIKLQKQQLVVTFCFLVKKDASLHDLCLQHIIQYAALMCALVRPSRITYQITLRKRLSENEASLNIPFCDLKCTFILNLQTIASLPLRCCEWLKPLLCLHFYSVRWMHRWKNHPSSPCQVLSDAELWRGFDLIWFVCRWERGKNTALLNVTAR